MQVKWRVILDRYSEESRAKSGCVHTVVETGDMLIRKYEEEVIKPEIEIAGVGMGHALSAYLTDKGFPHTVKECLLNRVGSADIYKGPKCG